MHSMFMNEKNQINVANNSLVQFDQENQNKETSNTNNNE